MGGQEWAVLRTDHGEEFVEFFPDEDAALARLRELLVKAEDRAQGFDGIVHEDVYDFCLLQVKGRVIDTMGGLTIRRTE